MYTWTVRPGPRFQILNMPLTQLLRSLQLKPVSLVPMCSSFSSDIDKAKASHFKDKIKVDQARRVMAKSPLSKRPKTPMELPAEDRGGDPSPDWEWEREKERSSIWIHMWTNYPIQIILHTRGLNSDTAGKNQSCTACIVVVLTQSRRSRPIYRLQTQQIPTYTWGAW